MKTCLHEIEDSFGAELRGESQTRLPAFPRQQRSLSLPIQHQLIPGTAIVAVANRMLIFCIAIAN